MRIKLSKRDIPTRGASGYWPVNALDDINHAKYDGTMSLLPREGYPTFFLAGRKKTLNLLDAQLPDTEISYKTFLLNNNLIEDIVKLPNVEAGSVIVFVFFADFNEFPCMCLEFAAVRIINVEGYHSCKEKVIK